MSPLPESIRMGRTSRDPPGTWVGAWASSQQIPEPRNTLLSDDLRDATLRQIVRLSLGGDVLRIRLSNAFGTAPLFIEETRVARPLSTDEGNIDSVSDRGVLFSGKPDVVIPAGAEYLSDPVEFPVEALSDLAISVYLKHPPSGQTCHPGARQISFLVHGNCVSKVVLADAKRVHRWYFISGVDVYAPPRAAAIVAIGDSITDGRGSTTNGNDRWPDQLARRLRASPKTRWTSVLNLGTGGNRLLLDGNGPNALSRFNRDVMAQTGVRYLIVIEGINDLGHAIMDGDISSAEHQALVARIIDAYRQIVVQAHTHGIKVMGGTLTPFMGSTHYQPGPAIEADRQTINRWIRQSGNFDAVADFDEALRDPEHPDRLLPIYDAGEHIDPSPLGYRVMADAIPLWFFLPDA